MKAVNIQWDTDGDQEVLEELPAEMEIPEGMTDTEEISDYVMARDHVFLKDTT